MLDTQTHKARLEEMLALVIEELQSIGIHNPDNPSDWVAVPEEFDANEPDLNDAADTVENWNERAALVATLEPKYNDIMRALEKINTETFGTCEVCNGEIEERRLEVNPAARTCIAHIEEPVV